VTLLALLREHGDVIEADVQREYRVDLTDLWRGSLSLRRVRVLLDRLPPDCATAYVLSGVDLVGWRLRDLLLARLTDELALYRWEWEAANGDGKRHRPPPDSVLPELPRSPAELRVVPTVSPHSLGSFVHDSQEVSPHGI
jgi:hypothetical protein